MGEGTDDVIKNRVIAEFVKRYVDEMTDELRGKVLFELSV
jgi:hypothetical protein